MRPRLLDNRQWGGVEQHLAKKTFTSKAALEGERKQVTVRCSSS